MVTLLSKNVVRGCVIKTVTHATFGWPRLFGQQIKVFVIFRTAEKSEKNEKREKSLLKYLTNVAKEVISSSGEERPSLSSCEDEDKTKSLWKMDTPFLWRT